MERIGGVTVQVLVEGGQLLLGPNDIVVEVRPSADLKDVALIAARAGVPTESVNIDLSSDGGGRFHGTVTLPWLGRCRLEVAWRDRNGRHRHEFVVPVVVGHH
jgi:hypothetical protein